mmetsp:Transcript_37750/g.87241  ORF Transcript_37750/g.87241 Transcript_37750/m.87241 type:complete len:203 (+) Transcript_37750:1352-1960(+)
MVWHICPARFAGFPEGLLCSGDRAASKDQCNSTSHSRADSDVASSGDVLRRRAVGLQCDLHRALLHHVEHMAAPLLLLVWLLGSCPVCACHHVLRGVHRVDLLPVVCSGSPLVVAVIWGRWIIRSVHVLVLCHVLLHEVRHYYDGLYDTIFQLHDHRLGDVLPSNRGSGRVGIILLRQDDLLVREDRLNAAISGVDVHVTPW